MKDVSRPTPIPKGRKQITCWHPGAPFDHVGADTKVDALNAAAPVDMKVTSCGETVEGWPGRRRYARRRDAAARDRAAADTRQRRVVAAPSGARRPAAGDLPRRVHPTLLFDDGKTALLTDGFFTRPGKLRTLLGRVAPDTPSSTRRCTGRACCSLPPSSSDTATTTTSWTPNRRRPHGCRPRRLHGHRDDRPRCGSGRSSHRHTRYRPAAPGKLG
jgi:hypothetical protein